MIPIFLRSVMPHVTRGGVIRSVRSVFSRKAPVRSVSSCRASSNCYSSSEMDKMKSLFRNSLLWIVTGALAVACGQREYEKEILLRETHDFARDALARGESKLDN